MVSGNTLANGRGSVLVATPGSQRDAFYVGAKRTPAGWRLTTNAGAAPAFLSGAAMGEVMGEVRMDAKPI